MITCISDLYYKFGWWFTVAMFAIAFMTLPFALEVCDSVWSFLMCAGIAFVGAAPHYKGHDRIVHYVSACVSALCSLVWVACVMPECFYALFVCLALVVADTKRWLLWCELTCFAMVYMALLLA